MGGSSSSCQTILRFAAAYGSWTSVACAGGGLAAFGVVGHLAMAGPAGLYHGRWNRRLTDLYKLESDQFESRNVGAQRLHQVRRGHSGKFQDVIEDRHTIRRGRDDRA
jgi:hypothetical protein